MTGAQKVHAVLLGAKNALHGIIGCALQVYLRCKKLQWNLLQLDVSNHAATNEWLNIFLPFRQTLQRKSFIVLIGSIMAAMLIMVGAPSSCSNSPTWALTEENLIFLEAWRTIDRAYIDKTFNGQSWFRYREEALRHCYTEDACDFG